jgi:formylglycine-generating enzyme required for sulfatase activity
VSATDNDQPASYLSQDDADAFIAALTTKTGLKLSLPTDAQYRTLLAGSAYPWGGQGDIATATTYAVCFETRANGDGPAKVATKAASDGLYDLVGNSREWTDEGHLFGGSWADNIRVIGLNPLLGSVDPSVRHPLSGMRIVATP